MTLNLGILGCFKYYDFFASELAGLLGLQADGLMLHLVLPVGISFYTFQALSYSIDVYRGRLQPTRDAVAFFAYISFFPQLVAGPIERATNLLPQFERERRFDYAMAADGCRQMLWGLFKKMVVADNCAEYVDKVFALGGIITPLRRLRQLVDKEVLDVYFCDDTHFSRIAARETGLLVGEAIAHSE